MEKRKPNYKLKQASTQPKTSSPLPEVVARNKKGETKSEALARVSLDHPGKTVEFEDPDTAPLAAPEPDEDDDWVRTYERGTGKAVFKPEHPSRRGLQLLQQLWRRIRPGLVDRFGESSVPVDVPKDCEKWATLPDYLEMMMKSPHVQTNIFDWLDKTVPKSGVSVRGGACTLKRLKNASTARDKQYGSGTNNPRPSFTFFGNRIPYFKALEFAKKEIARAKNAGLYADSIVAKLDEESLDKWYSVMGGRCSSFVFLEATQLFHGMTPHQDSAFPVPVDVAKEAFDEVLREQFPNLVDTANTLPPKELFVGTSNSGGIYIQNRDGAAGWPYINWTAEQFADRTDRKLGTRPSKGSAFQHALKDLVTWIEAGMPMKGPLYRRVAQPATLAYRGDRAVDLNIRALATRGPDAATHASQAQLAALLPSRSVIIVPTILVLAQSTWAQPLGDYIVGVASPGFDWVDPDHTVKRLNDIRRADLDQSDPRGRVAAVGADASGWDRDVPAQEHAYETGFAIATSPEEVDLLYIDASLPVDVDLAFTSAAKARLAAGGEEQTVLTGVDAEGGEHKVDATMRVVSFNYHDFISKIMTMINDCPLAWADYQGDAKGVIADVPGSTKYSSKMRRIVSNGGRRSGDAFTGLANTFSNLVVSKAASILSRDPRHSKLLARRCSLQGVEPPKPHFVLDDFARGDDRAVAIVLPGGGVPSEAVAGGIVAVGRRANAAKQEASDIPGTPVFGFANVIVTENYMGKLLGRSLQRYLVQETSGISIEMLNAVKSAGNDTELSDLLVATTAAAKARIAPLAGYPLMSEHPAVFNVATWAVHNDKHRLAYLSDDSFDSDGSPTKEAKELTRRAADVEAAAQARLRARRENVSVDLERLKEVYAGSTIHDHVEEIAFDRNYVPTKREEPTDNSAKFSDAVRKGELPEL